MTRNHLRTGALGAAVLIVAGLVPVGLPSALHAEGPAQELVTATLYAGGVDFQPHVPFRRAVLTVSGNCQLYSRVFEAGERLSLGLLDPEGQPLAPGTYTWSLELVPDAATARELRIAATRNGGEAPAPWAPQPGSFTVFDGSIVDQGLEEAAPGRGFNSGLSSSTALAGPLPATNAVAEDTDSAVGTRQGVEAESRAALARAKARPALVGGLQHPDRANFEREDATAQALGGSPEPTLDNQSPAQSRSATPRPRSDGSNGRPRS